MPGKAGRFRFGPGGLQTVARHFNRFRGGILRRHTRRAAAARAAAKAGSRAYFAAITMISTVNCGAASLASTVARAGVLPGDTQPSHTAFISPNVFMSVM